MSRKIHGDFGDMTRYDVIVGNDVGTTNSTLQLGCQDCSCTIAEWPASKWPVNLADINRIAAEHEISEERDGD